MSLRAKFIMLYRDALAHEQGLGPLVKKSLWVALREGPRGFSKRTYHLEFHHETTFADWVLREYELGDRTRARRLIWSFSRRPKISILCPTYNPDPAHLHAAIQSVRSQVYRNWELCIADDCSTDIDVASLVRSYRDRRIRFVAREENGNISAATNSALALASGDYVTFLDQDDQLSPFALFWVAELLDRRPDVKIVYSDEDKLSEEGLRCDPHFKPDWNYDYLLGHNYICHLAVYDRELVEQLGGMREGFEGAQDHDLALRAVEHLEDGEIAHIPRLLYHWRMHSQSTSADLSAKPFALQAAEKALTEHLARTCPGARLESQGTKFRVRFPIPESPPPVTIIIPTRDRLDLLENCVDSIRARTNYPNWHILIIDNGSEEEETLAYFESLKDATDVTVLHDPRPFNYAALMNDGIAACDTDLLCLLNNDTEVITPEWLDEMVANACRPNVGIVGAKLLFDDDTVQHGGVILGIGDYQGLGGVAGHAHKYLPGDFIGYFDRLVLQHQLSAVTGACMLVKREAFESAGGFDEENLASAFNDIDFCLKVREAGYHIVWTPYAILYHHESKSRGLDDTPEKQQRFMHEVRTMLERWGDTLRNDPHYNPNLTITHENFDLAPTSRNPMLKAFVRQRRLGIQYGVKRAKSASA